jgi:glutamyl-tRNA(Gln) amidotransferase subunit E
MYPETDVKPVLISQDRLRRLESLLPEKPEVKLERIQSKYNLNEKLASQIVDSDYVELFEELAAENIDPTLLAVTLTEDLTMLRREGLPVDNLTDEHISNVFKLVAAGRTAKESLPEVLTWLSENPDEDGETALRTLGLGMMNSEELDKIIKTIVQEKLNLLEERGMEAFGPLMGIAMSQVRGRANPKKVQKVLQKYINENI